MLLALIAAEFATAVVLVLVLLFELLTDAPTSLGTAIALLVMAALVALGIGAVLLGVWRGRAWVRAAALVIQVLIAAIGLGALQGALAQPEWGWPLIGVGIVGFGLVASKSVAGWLTQRDD